MPSRLEYDAVVVGSGPNGLAAAITIAQEGRSVLILEAKDTIGGGTRTEELTLPGFRHDVCSAIHPLALTSPFFRSLDLEAHGLEWIHPPVPLAHPLDDGSAVLLERSLEATAEGLGQDADRYRRLIGPAVRDWDELIPELLKPLGIPSNPFPLLRFGPHAMRSAVGLARAWFKGGKAQALFAGNSAHAIFPLQHPSSAGFGLMLCMSGHAVGWPIARGGSQAIADALASYFVSLGGEVRAGSPVSSMSDLPKARAILFDVTPKQLARIAGSILPSYYRSDSKDTATGQGSSRWIGRSMAPFHGEIPVAHRQAPSTWVAPLRKSLLPNWMSGGESCLKNRSCSCLNPASSIRAVPPMVCTRPGDIVMFPMGATVDMTQRIEAQVERFAPGFRSRVLARHTMLPAEMEAYNANYVGGDIAGGVQSFWQLFVRPLGRWGAYSTPVRGLYVCSSSMPPGAGVHGMCGHLAAKLALKEVL